MDTATRPGYLTSDDVCDIAGVTYRQLDYWTRLGLVETIGPAMPGSGGVRRFLRREVRVVAAVAMLRDLGATEPTLRHVAPMLRALLDEEWAGTLIVTRDGDCLRSRIDSGWILDLGRIAARSTV